MQLSNGETHIGIKEEFVLLSQKVGDWQNYFHTKANKADCSNKHEQESKDKCHSHQHNFSRPPPCQLLDRDNLCIGRLLPWLYLWQNSCYDSHDCLLKLHLKPVSLPPISLLWKKPFPSFKINPQSISTHNALNSKDDSSPYMLVFATSEQRFAAAVISGMRSSENRARAAVTHSATCPSLVSGELDIATRDSWSSRPSTRQSSRAKPVPKWVTFSSECAASPISTWPSHGTCSCQNLSRYVTWKLHTMWLHPFFCKTHSNTSVQNTSYQEQNSQNVLKLYCLLVVECCGYNGALGPLFGSS